MRATFRQHRAWLIGTVALLLGACAEPGADGGSPGPVPPLGPGSVPVGGDDVGSIALQLTLGTNFRFTSFDYEITGNGFQRAASVDVGGSSTFTTIVGSIPFGNGYIVRLRTQDEQHRLAPCEGSATFDIAGSAVVTVPVHLACHEVPAAAPQAVPIPRAAAVMIAAVLLAFGAGILQQRRRRPRT